MENIDSVSAACEEMADEAYRVMRETNSWAAAALAARDMVIQRISDAEVAAWFAGHREDHHALSQQGAADGARSDAGCCDGDWGNA
jgi:hypothetical protein